jgi:hypothetical protein
VDHHQVAEDQAVVLTTTEADQVAVVIDEEDLTMIDAVFKLLNLYLSSPAFSRIFYVLINKKT